jgi:hypothetical protein
MGFFSAPKSYQTSESSSTSGLDPAALNQWSTLFHGAQQGIAPWQQAGFNQAINQATNKFSALDAARGGQNPFTGPQIASSAAQYVLPQFAEMNSNMLTNLLGQRQVSSSTSKSNGTNSGGGIGYNWANDFGNNVTKWAGPGAYSPAPGGKG